MESIVKAVKARQHKRCLDLFARDGGMVTSAFEPFVDGMIGVDVNPSYLDAYRARFGRKVGCTMEGDSVALLKAGVFRPVFDMVIVDNPQGVYGNGYMEHFDFFDLLPSTMEDRATLIFITNLCPHANAAAGMDSYGMADEGIAAWRRSRDAWYQTKADFLCQEFVVSYYLRRLWDLGVLGFFAGDYLRPSAVLDHPDHIYYVAFDCTRR